MQYNSIIEQMPKYLKNFIVDQDYGRYTSRDHAIWRYVMHRNIAYLRHTAHPSYLNGLKQTGISIDRIPSIDDMNRILSKIGWAAVCVDGFIPPSMFMAFQKYRVLVIAADIRPVNQIDYTPAPDILHEAAGHAPIIADPDYSDYLIYFGKLGSMAFPSEKDNQLYEAIRHLSILKADPTTPKEEIQLACDELDYLNTHMGMPSEMALIRNLHWWTVEYGLVGDIEKPKIYGAGLLSSIKESKSALEAGTPKIPYSIDAMDYSFDITKPQEQLFVSPSFEYLSFVLDEFASKMALKTGGLEAVLKAIHSGSVSTLEFSSGLQVSGKVTDVITHNGQVAYFKTSGPTILSYKNKLLQGHSVETHFHGFGAPVGRLKGTMKPLRLFSESDLIQFGIQKGKRCKLELESEVIVEGKLQSVLRKGHKIILMSFTECTVRRKKDILFEPDWGVYDMAIGEKIISAFYGPADPESFNLEYALPAEKTHRIQYTVHEKRLFELFTQVRKMEAQTLSTSSLSSIWDEIKQNYPDEWLLPFEIQELLSHNQTGQSTINEIKIYLNNLQKKNKELSHIAV
ncbi:MAG: aromatic amino acid hydroxylase [Bacteroidales bacterium]|nr:aromatic amino acid hydroxylase [Bacteroidales bacterium]